MTSAKTIRALWYVALSLILGVGAYAIGVRLHTGLRVTNITSFVPWGAWVAFYIYFVGLSAGAFLLSSLVYVFDMTRYERIGRTALLTALIAMVVALAFIGLDLGRWDRAFTPLYRFNWLSPLAWEVRFYVAYIFLLGAELWLSLDAQRNQKWLRVLGIIGIPLAIFGVHGGTGTIFAVVKARAFWSGPLFPVLFIVSALVSGTALLILFHVVRQWGRGLKVDAALVRELGKLLAGFLAVDLGIMFYEFLVPALAIDPAHGVKVGVGYGLLVPAIILLSGLAKDWRWTATAAAWTVANVLTIRFGMVIPAQHAPLLPGLPAGQYTPNLIEWTASAGLIAFGLLLFSLIAEKLPLEAHGGAHDEQAA